MVKKEKREKVRMINLIPYYNCGKKNLDFHSLNQEKIQGFYIQSNDKGDPFPP